MQAMLLCGHVAHRDDMVRGLVFKEATRTSQHRAMQRVGVIQFWGENSHRILAEVN